jgi:hypothetical protein
MAEVVKATFEAYFRYADGFSANNLMHAAVDNIYEFSKRFIGIFLNANEGNSRGNKFRNLVNANVFLKMIFYIIIDDIHSVVILYLHFMERPSALIHSIF